MRQAHSVNITQECLEAAVEQTFGMVRRGFSGALAPPAHHFGPGVQGPTEAGICGRLLPNAVYQRIDPGTRAGGGPADPGTREYLITGESAVSGGPGQPLIPTLGAPAQETTLGLEPVTVAIPAPGLEQVREFVRASKAENTLRGYRADWADFSAWCDARGLRSIPAAADAVAGYIAECAGHLKPGSIQRRLNAIAEAHKAAGLESPTHAGLVRNTFKGIRRTLGTAPAQKSPALTEEIRRMVEATDAGLIGTRDRALILLGFAGAFRRSELVGLDVEDCAFTREGLTVLLRRSKTDQEGQGRKVGIPYGACPDTCPVRSTQEWLEQAGISRGPLFRSINRHGHVQEGRLAGLDVARIVKKLALRAGLEPAKYAGHSLRAGHATSAAMAGASERSIMQQTGHRSVAMVRRYIREGSLFRENSAAKLGL